jgi:hypothetical protein
MPTYRAQDLAGFAANAGFTGDAAVKAVAIALAESGGRSDVVNSIGATGLWQINQPVHVKAHPGWTQAYLKDPINNAKAAYELSSGGTNWKPWVVYTTGAYLLYMPQAKTAVDANGGSKHGTAVPDNPLIPDAIEQQAQGLAALAQFPAKILAWISDRNNSIRIAKVVVGGGLVIGALIVVSRPVIEPAVKTVAKVI